MVLKYTDKVIDHFRNPRNAGEMEDATISATEGSLACGDMMTLYLKIEDNVIKEAKFESYGCAANIATGSVLTEMVKGKTVEEAEAITWNDIVEALDGLPQIKYHCSTLSIDTLKAALKKYREMSSSEKEAGVEMRHTEKGGLRKLAEGKVESNLNKNEEETDE